MFSTESAVSDEQPSHVLLKTPLPIIAGFQFENTSSEKSVSDEQFNHVESIVTPTGIETSNEGSDEHPSNAKRKSVTKGRAALKLVRDVHIRQAAKALVTRGRSELKLASDVQL